MKSLASALLAGTILAGPALAQEMPSMAPDRDVSGTYLITKTGGQPSQQSMAMEYSKSSGTLRVNMPQNQGMAGYILYDFGTKDAKMVMPQMQKYMDYSTMAAGFTSMAHAHQGGASGDDVSITRGGSETIAGHECHDIIATDHTKNKTATLCLTDDHVLLSMTSSDGFSLVAQSISYGAVPDSDVQVPPGFTEFVMPQMPAGMGAGPGQ